MKKNVETTCYSGEALKTHIGVLSEFRLRYFQEFPYLYVGTAAMERDYAKEYTSAASSRLFVARDAETVVGVAIGTALSAGKDIVKQIGPQMAPCGWDIQRFYYIGEMIFAPEYRHCGLGGRMMESLRETARQQGMDRLCFLAVRREKDDPRRPADYYDAGRIFEKMGFVKTPLSVEYAWMTIQVDARAAVMKNRLDFWVEGE